MSMGTYAALAAAAALAAWWGTIRRTRSYRSKFGLSVIMDRQVPLSIDQIDDAIHHCIRTFHDRGLWTAKEMVSCVRSATIRLLFRTSYENHGRRVIGHVSGRLIVLAVNRRPLSASALAHELAHYFEMQLDGYTDGTHKTWHREIFPAIDEANRRIAAP